MSETGRLAVTPVTRTHPNIARPEAAVNLLYHRAAAVHPVPRRCWRVVWDRRTASGLAVPFDVADARPRRPALQRCSRTWSRACEIGQAEAAYAGAVRTVPTGTVTFLFTDIEGSAR